VCFDHVVAVALCRVTILYVIAAIVLAAGDSTRMGSPKALLPDPDGRAFVARIVRTFAAAGIADLVIVTGSQHDAIVAAVEADQPPITPVFARNPDPSRGQLSSLWVGLDAVMRSDLEAVLMTLVDVPMLQSSTVQKVVDAWRRTSAPVVRPAIGARHGHPVLFDRALFPELRRAPLDQGAKVVVHAYANRIVNVPVDDPGSLIDVDTPSDYKQMMKEADA
jgi:molybdenum cofactor cytidylyltransferase